METFSLKKCSFQIFGSATSLDLDICFFVTEIGTVTENNAIIQKQIEVANLKTKKRINGNLAVIKDGILVDCFKGTMDELNNALFHTYGLHKQSFEKKIKGTVQRDVLLKVQRALRTIVSMFTRTHLRPQAKQALRSQIGDKIQFLEQIRLEDFIAFGKNGTPIEVYKTIAFQLGQTIGLLQAKEHYTKESIIADIIELKPYLLREKSETQHLQKCLTRFILSIKNDI